MEQVIVVEQKFSKEELVKQVMAMGINSLASSWSENDQVLISQFAAESFDLILDCWPYLNDKAKFQIFLEHLDGFATYMRAQTGRK